MAEEMGKEEWKVRREGKERGKEKERKEKNRNGRL